MGRYLTFIFVFSGFFTFLIVSLNSFFDPFWLTGKAHFFNKYKLFTDERAQKTNLLIHGSRPFNTLLLGSSRTTYINVSHFQNKRVFNYAAESMYPEEYKGYLNIAQSKQKIDFLIIGLDFFGTNRLKTNPSWSHIKSPLFYKERALKPFSQLFTLKGLGLIYKNSLCSLYQNCHDVYDERFIKRVIRPSSRVRLENFLINLTQFHEKFYTKDYQWNPELPSFFKEIASENISTTVFTTPISAPLFSLLVKSHRFPDYERWIRLIVAQFGHVWDFMGINSVTSTFSNYLDAHHFLPEVGDLIIDRLENRLTKGPEDFGVKVTKENLDKHLKNIAQQSIDPTPLQTLENLIEEDKKRSLLSP